MVGAGMSGLGCAIKFSESGMKDFTIVERWDGVGGTWKQNTYPGLACDVPSTLYSYSFRPNPEWKYFYGRQQEMYV
jgi:cation diffusion facilitator CzcD-associated flavoprotein CzcO